MAGAWPPEITGCAGSAPTQFPAKWHEDRRRPGIESPIHVSLVVDGIRSKDNEIRICAYSSELSLDIAGAKKRLVKRYIAMLLRRELELQRLVMPAKEVSRPHDEQGAVVLRQYLRLDYICVPLLPFGLVWS